MKLPIKKRNKRYKPRPIILPKLIQGYDMIDSVRNAIAVIRRQFDGSDEILPRQGLADLNMMFQQVTKVHERAGKTSPDRRDIFAAQNVLARLNADAEIKRSEFDYVVNVLQAVVASVRENVPIEVWHDVQVSMDIKQLMKGSTEELWFGGLLLANKNERVAA